MFEAKSHLRALLEEFQRVCPSGLNFWLDAGTLLGQQRNQEFIPWDDDVDVGLLRKDFNSLTIALANYKNSRFVLHLPETSNCVPVNFDSIKIRDTWTLGYEKGYTPDNVPDAYSGIALDIVPFDQAPIKIFFMPVSILSKLHARFRYTLFKNGSSNSAFQTFVYTAYTLFFKFCLMVIPKTRSYIVPSWFGSYPHRRHRTSDMFPSRDLVFEGVNVKVPKDPSAYLTLLYGQNFMDPPPRERRKSHFGEISTTQHDKDASN